MVKNMENFSLNSAKSYIGKHVNLHLKDGSVIINVHLNRIKKNAFKKQKLLEYTPYKTHKPAQMLLHTIAYAELVNPNLMQTSN